MKMRISTILLIIFFAAPGGLHAAKPSVGVVNFTNHTSGAGLQYLSKSLPESISATLSGSKDIRVVERAQLAKIVDEIALGQTGLFNERQISRAGRMIRADVLIIGSYSGNPERIVLTMKAVRVTTASACAMCSDCAV